MITVEQLEAMKKIDISKIDRNALVDIRTVKINMELPLEERLQQFLEQIKNPYCYLNGDMVVVVRHNENMPFLYDALKQYLISIKSSEGDFLTI